jgi:putative ABC transport system permease protein
MLAGRLAARETVRASAVAAVSSSAVDQAPVGGTRRLLAVLCAVAGLAAAGAPAVVPGTVGGATAATSAFLLIGAVALAGPLLVRAAFGRVGLRGDGPAGVASRLAVLNVRGFSRRLTAVVVPLTLALAVGTVQASVDLTVGKAAAQQLRAAVTADLVVTGDQPKDRLAGLAAVPGVSDAVPLADLRIKVRTDDDDLPDSLVWELSTLKVVPADAPRTTFDPRITRGSLAALSGGGTVAISSDAAFEQGVGTGDRIAVGYGGVEHRLRVVAVFDRGLGLGDYLTGPATAAALGATPSPDATLLSVSGAAKAATAARLTALGLTVLTPEEYVASVSSGTAATQHLSTVLLLLLLVFVGLGAANALVLTTAGRRAELALLHRTGATRRQLLRMAFVESALTGGLAWLVGTLVVIPAVVGVSVGLLGWHLPVVALGTYAVVSSAVLVVAVGATVLPTAWVLRHRPAA